MIRFNLSKHFDMPTDELLTRFNDAQYTTGFRSRYETMHGIAAILTSRDVEVPWCKHLATESTPVGTVCSHCGEPAIARHYAVP